MATKIKTPDIFKNSHLYFKKPQPFLAPIIPPETDVNRIKRKVHSRLDKATFPRIFLFYIGFILFLGFVYYHFEGTHSYLFYSDTKEHVTNIKDTIYFSFVTATTLGYGDILPVGNFKGLAAFEVVMGLIVLALVTSKLISIKQDILLSEMYEFSFHEKINRLRSSLLLLRKNIGKLIKNIEEHYPNDEVVYELEVYGTSLQQILMEISSMLTKPEDHDFIKTLDPANTELLLTSVLKSFERMNFLFVTLKKHAIEDGTHMKHVTQSLHIFEHVLDRVESTSMISSANSEIIKEQYRIIKNQFENMFRKL